MQTGSEEAKYPLQHVCDTCEVPEHVLVYWADYFPELKDTSGHLKTLFTEGDLYLVQRIKKCLYSRFMTVQEARRIISEENSVSSSRTEAPQSVSATNQEEASPSMPVAPVFATSVSPEAPKDSFSERISGGLKQLEEVLTEQKTRFEDSLTNQREEFSAVKSECAARLSDLTSALDCAKEKNDQMRRLVDQAIKDLEALRFDAFGYK